MPAYLSKQNPHCWYLVDDVEPCSTVNRTFVAASPDLKLDSFQLLMGDSASSTSSCPTAAHVYPPAQQQVSSLVMIGWPSWNLWWQPTVVWRSAEGPLLCHTHVSQRCLCVSGTDITAVLWNSLVPKCCAPDMCCLTSWLLMCDLGGCMCRCIRDAWQPVDRGGAA